ncbi:MAG TPA: PilZ domain-containing protein [Nitrospirales bacterium]|nr:PilZ domain-containing protein [Nitrospirales bacterium]
MSAHGYHPRSPRVPFRCLVRFVGEGFEGKGLVADFSERGLKISSVTVPAKWHELEIELFLPDHHRPLTIRGAVVRWSRQGLFGVTFDPLPEADLHRIRTVVASAVPEPAPSDLWRGVRRSIQRTRWMPAVIVGSVLAASLAVGLAYVGRVFYGYEPHYYEPKDEERAIHQDRLDRIKRAKDGMAPP